jgi:hypothetical protein
MLSSNARRRIFSFSLFFLPVVIVKVMGGLLGGDGPQNASATVEPAAPAHVSTTENPVDTRATEAANAHRRQLAAQPFSKDPFYHEEPTSEPVAETPVEAPEPGAPAIALHMIMAARSGNVAVINGKPYRLKDEIAHTGWYLTTIDPNARSITLTQLSTGKKITAAVDPKPSK